MANKSDFLGVTGGDWSIGRLSDKLLPSACSRIGDVCGTAKSLALFHVTALGKKSG